MPHQCTNCGRTFPDGSKEMLSGCPDCGGNKFQFEPSGGSSTGGGGSAGQSAATAPPESAADAPESSDPPSDSGVSETVSQAKRTVRDWVGRDGLTGSDDGAATTSESDSSTADTEPTRDSSSTAGAESTRDSSSTADAESTRDSSSTADAESTSDWPDVGSRNHRDASSGSTDDSESRSTSSPESTSTAPQPQPAGDADAPSARGNAAPASENSAQAEARSDVVDPDDLPGGAPSDPTANSGHPFDSDENEGPPDDADGEVVGTPDDDQPDLEALRKELNEQFESIKIVRPGEYELNLMELYDRDEYIISLMEDGRYAIEVPDAWRGGE